MEHRDSQLEWVMLILQIVLDVVLMIFVLAFLPLFLGDLLLFADPASSVVFIVFAAAFVAVLWIIDHITDEYFLQAVSGRLHMTTKASNQDEWALPALS
jgi:hypothetical protein